MHGNLDVRLTPRDVPFRSFELGVTEHGERQWFARASTERGVRVTAKRGFIKTWRPDHRLVTRMSVDTTVVVEGVRWRLRGSVDVADVRCDWDAI